MSEVSQVSIHHKCLNELITKFTDHIGQDTKTVMRDYSIGELFEWSAANCFEVVK